MNDEFVSVIERAKTGRYRLGLFYFDYDSCLSTGGELSRRNVMRSSRCTEDSFYPDPAWGAFQDFQTIDATQHIPVGSTIRQFKYVMRD